MFPELDLHLHQGGNPPDQIFVKGFRRCDLHLDGILRTEKYAPTTAYTRIRDDSSFVLYADRLAETAFTARSATDTRI